MAGYIADMSWLGKEPVIEETQISETIHTEVLIAGGGTGGLTAAASAAELGLKVLLIEIKRNFTPMRKEIGAVGSRIQKAEGAEIDIQELARQHVMYNAGYIDQRLPLLWARESGEMMDWYAGLITARGAKMLLQGGYRYEAVPGSYTKFPTGHKSVWPKGVDGVKVITQHARAYGAEFRMQTGLVKLLKDGSRVTGAIAKDMKTGSYIRINALKGVIIATGGYANNKSMLKALQPETALMAGFTISEGATKGDGISACLWAGAGMDDHHTSILFDRCAIMPDETPATLRKPGHPTEFIGQPFLKVDLKGRRFMNESVPYDFIIHRAISLPGQCYCVIFDSGYPKDTKRFELAGCSRMHPFNNGAPCSRPLEDNIVLLEGMVREGRVIKADTIDALARGPRPAGRDARRDSGAL